MNNKTIQTALALLVTNLNVLENYDGFREEFIVDLNLNQNDTRILDNFYKCHKNQFIASARILKKNRWDDIKATLPITVSFLKRKTLDNLWDNYLASLKIKDNPPKNPLAESIFFALFTEQSPLLNPVEKELVKYERIRNEVTYKHHEKFSFPSLSAENLTGLNNLANCRIYMHECYRIEKFEFNIPLIINKKNPAYSKENCTVLFFKNLQKEGIGTLSLSNDVKKIIEKANTCKSLSETYSFFEKQLSPSEFLRFFKNIAQLGVWIIQRREG